MYALQQLRFRELLQRISSRLEDMALDPRAFPGVASEARQLKSSASTPSLRSRESELVPVGKMTSDHGGGNVRVVVRVRGFLPRGETMIRICLIRILNSLQRSNGVHNVLSR